MRFAWLVLVAACVQPSLLECPDSGLVCVPGDVCDTVHHLCITPAQQVPCVGKPDESICAVAGAPGYCRDQICLLPVCGNHYVDHGEVCDDGNQVSGDGCNALCTSTEQCGNGVLDPGEVCDDGDRISGDGCDSQCKPETFSWQVFGSLPRYETGNHHAVFDRARHQIVLVADDVTWTWDGTDWSVLAVGTIPADTMQAPWLWHQLAWDSQRNTVILVGLLLGTSAVQAWEWNGTQWTQIATPNPPMITAGQADYDVATDQVVVVGARNAGAWALDVASGTWKTLAAPPIAIDTSYGVAYDIARGVLVVGAMAQTNFVAMTEWNGSAWSPAINALVPSANDGLTFVWDPITKAVLAIGGINGGNVSGQVIAWTGAAWIARPFGEQLTAYKSVPEVVITENGTRIVWGGWNGSLEVSSLYQYASNGTWTGPLGHYPPLFDQGVVPYIYSYDSKRHRMLALGGFTDDGRTELWAFTRSTGWNALAPCPLNGQFNYTGAIGYDPERDAVVALASDAMTYVFHDDAWTATPTGRMSTATAITYDPVLHGLVAVDQNATWLLASSGGSTQIAGLPGAIGQYPTLAFDARTGQVLYVDSAGTYLLVNNDHWARTLSPGPSYVAIANSNRGSVELFTAGGANYERFDGQFSTETIAPPPVAMDGLRLVAAYAPETGNAILLGGLRYSRLVLFRSASGTLDQCTGNDDDGDGLVDCADPDCWWSCTPACPPHTSC